MQTIKRVQEEIVEEFDMFDEWMDKYTHLIEIGNELEDIDPKNRTPEYIIEGCQSKVWLHPEFRDGKVFFSGDSDALIVKGLVALVLKVYSGNTPQDILDNEPQFINDIGLDKHLSPTRANGLTAMIKQMRLYAIAYSRINSK